jgi:hypothetical protein
MHRHQHQHRRRRPRIPSTLPNNVKEHLPPSEGAGLISSRPNPVNKLLRHRSRFPRSLHATDKNARCALQRSPLDRL